MTDQATTTPIMVPIDTQGFAAEVAAMRGALESGLGVGADRAGRAVESALLRAVRTGKLGFDDLRRVAVQALAEIARQSIASGLGAVGVGGGKGSGGGLLSLASALVGLLGAPGRATGGPVAPGTAYRVGERGPEWFVPTSAGRIETMAGSGAARSLSITVNVAGGGDRQAGRMQASGRQIALAVRRAIETAER